MSVHHASLDGLAAVRAAAHLIVLLPGIFARRRLARTVASEPVPPDLGGPLAAASTIPTSVVSTFDPETLEWTSRVLGGAVRHPFPPGDPEGEHDACRLRGVLACLCRAVPDAAEDGVARRIRILVAYAADRSNRMPAVGWDATTAALRLVNLLVAAQELEARGLSLPNCCGDWMRPFLEAHRLPLRLGRLAEPSGNHRVLNGAGRVALSLLTAPGPAPQSLVLDLRDEVGRQFLPDGGHRERVPHYHVQVLAVLEILQQVDERRGGALRRLLHPLLRAPLHVLRTMLGPGGEPYRVGDVGRTFSGKLTFREVADLMGTPVSEPVPATTILPHFGIAGSGWVADGRHRLLAECGATGSPKHRGHGHADTQAFCYYLDGCEVVADPGTFVYSDAADAIWFRTPEAHAVVHWPRHPAAVPRRFFRWARRPPTGHPAGSEASSRQRSLLFASAADWRVHGRAFAHRRSWLREETGLAIVDNLLSPPGACAEVRFPLGPEATVTDVSGRRAIVKVGDRTVEFRVVGSNVGDGTVVPAWYAPRYGVRNETVGLVWPLTTGGRAEIKTWIGPVA